MSRPGSHRADVVDALAGATTALAWERSFNLDQLTRLQEAGALPGTAIELRLNSQLSDGQLELSGALEGQLVLTCQRCMRPAQFELHEPIAVRAVRDETEAAAAGEHEYVVADPARLDLRWLSEEQALLAMPLVPMHEPDECPQGRSLPEDAEGEEGIAASATQSPFANLRDLLKQS